MAPSPYLDMLDLLLRQGLAEVSSAFVETQTQFVLGCQQAEGGFCGRQGGSDLYYTDFALRCLALFASPPDAFARARNYLDSLHHEPASIAECFSFLNAHRLINALLGPRDEGADQSARSMELKIRKQLNEHRLPEGGFSRFRSVGPVSAYQTFLGALCLQMLGEDMPAATDAVAAIDSLQRREGGYAEFDGQTEPQTSATAAAVAFLMMHDAMTDEKREAVLCFLTKIQSRDGGLKAHAAIENGDLLSTFTGSLTLAGFDAFDSLEVPGIAEFLRTLAAPQGGFSACLGDDSPDVEYTYYGIATYSLLKQFLQQE